MILENRTYKAIDILRLAFKVAPLCSFIMLVLRLLSSITPALLVIVTANFINTALAIFEGSALMNQLYIPMLLLGFLTSFSGFVNVINKYMQSKFLIATRLTYRVAIIEKRARLEYCHIENQDTYDLIKRITDPAETQIIDQYDNLLWLIDVVIQTVSLLGILFVNVWWAMIVLICFSIPTFYVGVKRGKIYYEAERAVSDVARKAWYLAKVSNGRDAALERTLFGYSSKITDYLWGCFEHVRIHNQVFRRRMEIQKSLGGILIFLTTGAVIMALLSPVADGTLTIGLFISLVTACTSLTTTLGTSLPWILSNFTGHLEYLKDLSQFSQLEETADVLSKRQERVFEFEKIQFKQVTFSYPGTEKKILDNVSFTIMTGKHYAFVGENGAGKTTVIKLLTGQYLNYEGEILINDKDIKQYEAAELKAIFSVAYQDFAQYQISLKENMLIGDLIGTDDEKLRTVIADLELDEMIAKLPKGLDTPLGKLAADGVDISGGQWQKIALARTIINPAPIKILDEPTAALDPISESHLYEQFEKIIDNKTSIFISHRLGSIKLADEILVFDQGSVIEQGSHDMLMGEAGKYAMMYNSQLEWYQSSNQEVSTDG